MTVAEVPAPARGWLRVPVLVVAFAGAVALRVAVGGAQVVTSAAAGLVFAGALALLTVVAGAHGRVGARAIGVGLVGAVVLCVPPALHAVGEPRVMPTAGFASWAAVVGVVAVAEEAFLRGALYDAVAGRASVEAAVAVGAVCFAALHVPLYGWGAVPLDLAVGLWLGALRALAGTWVAPAVTHTAADWVAWFLR